MTQLAVTNAKPAPTRTRTGPPVGPALAVLALMAVAGLFAQAYVQNEHPAYIWDARCYWELYVTGGQNLKRGALTWLAGVLTDIRESDYNGLPSFLLTPVYLVFGDARAAFITALVVVYLVPAALVFGWVSRHLTQRDHGPHAMAWFAALCGLALFSAPLWAPTLTGMPDIIGCIPLLALIHLLLRTDLNAPQSRERLVTLGLLLWLPFLCRRWYAHAIISVVVTTAVFALFDHWRAWRARSPDGAAAGAFWPGRLIVNLVVIGAASALLVAGFQGRLAYRILTHSYAEAYSAYQLSGPLEHIERVYRHFGPVTLALAAFGLFVGVRDAQTRRATLFVFVSGAFGFVLFASVQVFAAHHYLPVAMSLLLLVAIGLSAAWRALEDAQVARGVAATALAAVSIAGLVHGVVSPIPALAPLLAQDTAYPRRVENLPEYQRLSRDLLVLVGAQGKLSTFASNDILCDSLLESLSGEALDPHIHFASQIDRRDLFDMDSLMSDYVVVADPVQTHLRPKDQQVIVRPAQALLQGTGIGQAYARLPQAYHLTSSVTAYVYRKVRPFRAEEVEALFADLFKAYPEWRTIYTPARRQRLIGP